MHILLPYLGKINLDHEITLHELKRLPVYPFDRWMKVFTVFGGLEFVFTLPGCWIPFVHWLWRIPSVMASSTMVSREIEDRTWHVLRVTPLTAREIMLAKYAAIFRYMDPHLMVVTYIRAVPAIIFAATWLVSTITVLPQQGFAYWFSRTVALAFAGVYFLISPVLDVAMDGAIGLLASTLSQRRSTALIMALLARMSGWLLPLALAAPLQFGQYGAFGGLFGGARPDFSTLRAISIVSTYGPTYAFLWGIPVWISVVVVVGIFLLRLGLVRLMLELAIVRADRIEV